MRDNIIVQHDILIEQYRYWRKAAEDTSDKQTARDLTFMSDGLSYAFCQIFGEDIKKAKLIYKGDD